MLGFCILKQKTKSSLPQTKESYAKKPTCIRKFDEDPGVVVSLLQKSYKINLQNIKELHRKIIAVQDSR